MSETQISTHISDATREQLEAYARAHGIKKGRLLEDALLHHLQALRELPADLILPPRLLVEAADFAKVARLVKRSRRPTQALRDLFAEGPPKAKNVR